MKQRSDLYMRMVDEDPDSTSTEENNNKAVSKLRWRLFLIFDLEDKNDIKGI